MQLTELEAQRLNSVSHATLRVEDLFPAFRDAVKAAHEILSQRGCDIGKNAGFPAQADVEWHACQNDEERNDVGWDWVEQFDRLLNDYAPDDYYFGTHPGDGSDFGFWHVDAG